MAKRGNVTRRTFLKTVGSSIPSLKLLLPGGTASGRPEAPPALPDADGLRFLPLDLAGHFSASPEDFGPRPLARSLSGDSGQDGIVRTPGGRQRFRGIPFLLGPEGIRQKSWIVLGRSPHAGTIESVEIPLGAKAGFICLAQFCDWDEGPLDYQGFPAPAPAKLGQVLAEVVLSFDDGTEHSMPIRRRFESNAPSTSWGFLSFASKPFLADVPRQMTDPLKKGTEWGALQYGYWDNNYPLGPDGRPLAQVWLCALENPEPLKTIKALRLKAASEDPLVVCGITLFKGETNPLRCERLGFYRLTLPEPSFDPQSRWKVRVDLGTIVRVFTLAEFDANRWLSSPRTGLGEKERTRDQVDSLYIEMAVHPEAVLTLVDSVSGRIYAFDLKRITPGRESAAAEPPGAQLEILEPRKAVLRVQVVDSGTHRPTPVRVSFRSPQGKYIPPFGHRQQINTGLFQDYGGDVKVLDSSFAYVDGTFQIELPIGEVFVEIAKGFEYVPVRQKIEIKPGQSDLMLEIRRLPGFSGNGWATADVHVHFLSPSTALLEGQAEGLNFVHLLAAQWGDLYTNVGDLSHRMISSPDGRTCVLMGTENRQHILGHIGLLGASGAPIFPLSADGPEESHIGDPLWVSLADWADECRRKEGLAVALHFPKPLGEIAADIVLGKIDAVEMYPYTKDCFQTFRFLEWYRYLNCGYRLPAVGGTDKMQASVPVGANRTYAYMGGEEFSLDGWARSVRSGNTFMTTGPLLIFQADGHVPGEEISLGAGGGTLDVSAEVFSLAPVHLLEVVWNGRVVARLEDSAGTRKMKLGERVRLSGTGWLAARCSSRLDPTSYQLAVAAHTSPIYLRSKGPDPASPSDLVYMLSLVDGAQTWVETMATRPDAERLARVSAVFQAARSRLHDRLYKLAP